MHRWRVRGHRPAWRVMLYFDCLMTVRMENLMDDFDALAAKLSELRKETAPRVTEQLGLESEGSSVAIPIDRLAEYMSLYVDAYVFGALCLYNDWVKDHDCEGRD